jgi:hypothetical protein
VYQYKRFGEINMYVGFNLSGTLKLLANQAARLVGRGNNHLPLSARPHIVGH